MKGKTKKVLLSLTAVAVFSLFTVADIAAQQADQQMMTTTKKQTAKKPRAKKKAGAQNMANAPVPKGVQKCIDHLIEMANAEPMTPYEGHPQKVINEGLMWNDEKSNCSIGADQDLRMKVLKMSNAWKMKDAATVRSLLAEIKSAAPQT